eukprot:762460-Hanusia_phi.AAC.5
MTRIEDLRWRAKGRFVRISCSSTIVVLNALFFAAAAAEGSGRLVASAGLFAMKSEGMAQLRGGGKKKNGRDGKITGGIKDDRGPIRVHPRSKSSVARGDQRLDKIAETKND